MAERPRKTKQTKKPRQAGTKKAAAGPQPVPIDEELVRQRAYLIYERRGRTPGGEVEDWMQAVAELSAESPSAE
jgi:hypothetical protein